jgi:hypothetical protein
MRWRALSLFLGIACLLLASYLGWALHRISDSVLWREARISNAAWPRPWPYPDEWLWRWHDQLHIEHPSPPNTLKMRGELPRMKMTLWGWIVVSAMAGGSLTVLGFRLIPYDSFVIAVDQPVGVIVERLLARIEPAQGIHHNSNHSYFEGTVWDSGFKVVKVPSSRGECPIVVRGRIEGGPEGTVVYVRMRLFHPVLGFLCAWFGTLGAALAFTLVKVLADLDNWPGRWIELLNALEVLVGLVWLSWAAILAWFLFSWRNSREEITRLLGNSHSTN